MWGFMEQSWDRFWPSFLETKKLNSKLRELNIIDKCEKTECICREIYNHYDELYSILEKVRQQFVKEIEYLPGVHLHTSRVKSVESVLAKLICKRHENLLNPNSLYSTITSEEFDSVITDLVGVRIIISYRGDWRQLHDEIVKKFPYKAENEYIDNRFIPHSDGDQFIAEIPKVYYSQNDDLSMFQGCLVKPLIKESGYRSVHYVISFMNKYVELQTRTIYDEAWSDCDHHYVYKHEENKSHAVLKELSDILCESTNAANDLGDLMQEIFDNENVLDIGNDTYSVSKPELIAKLNSIIVCNNEILEKLKQFNSKLRYGGESNEFQRKI